MPVYKPGRRVKKETTVNRFKKEARRYSKRKFWVSEGKTIEDTQFWLGFPLQKQVKKLCKTGNPVVVEYGCAKGYSTADLARTNPKARIYGFSRESYHEWNSLLNKDKHSTNNPNPNLRFIHAEARDFSRYFKDDTIDIMYSHIGLSHVKPYFLRYVKSLVPKLKIGGQIITDVPGTISDYSELIGVVPKKVKVRKQSHLEMRKTGFYEIKVDTYILPNYIIEFRPNATIVITRTK